MPFTLIKGTFHATGYSPDGDSMRFEAAQAANWKKLTGRRAERNARGHAQLRFEAIDTLETHYTVPGGRTHQPSGLADEATDFTLREAGITNVVWGPTHGRVTSANDGTPGYILARATERYGRPIAFVFGGTTNKADGSSVFLDESLLRQSINYRLIKAGLAYPTYYKGLFPDLREEITAGVLKAWNAGRGVWPYDWTAGVPVPNLAALEDYYVVMPKLFRRLAKYMATHSSVSGFQSWLAEDPEPILVLSTGHFTNFDSVVTVQDQTVSLTVFPEDLVFLD